MQQNITFRYEATQVLKDDVIQIHKNMDLMVMRDSAVVLGCQIDIYRDRKKVVNSLYHFCSIDPQFLWVTDWLLIATKTCILVRMT